MQVLEFNPGVLIVYHGAKDKGLVPPVNVGPRGPRMVGPGHFRHYGMATLHPGISKQPPVPVWEPCLRKRKGDFIFKKTLFEKLQYLKQEQ